MTTRAAATAAASLLLAGSVEITRGLGRIGIADIVTERVIGFVAVAAARLRGAVRRDRHGLQRIFVALADREFDFDARADFAEFMNSFMKRFRRAAVFSVAGPFFVGGNACFGSFLEAL